MYHVPGLSSTFRSRDFRFLWLATLGSSAGMWIEHVAVGWLVLDMTNSPFALGVVSAARMASFLVLGMPAGALADRLDRRKVLIATTVSGVAYGVALAVLVVTDSVQFWHVVVLTFLFGCTRAFETPSRQALVYDLVGADEVLRGISLNAMAQRVTGIFGGVLSGVLIPIVGVEGSLLLMALCYGGGVLSLGGMRAGAITEAGSRVARLSFWQSITGGLGLIRSHQVVLALVLLSVVAEIFAFSNATLTPVFARDVLAAGVVGLGLLTAARSLGAIAATLVLAALTYRQDKVALLLWAFALFGGFLVLFATSHSFPVSLILMVGIGCVAAAFDILQQTILQLSVSDHERGRVMGYWAASLGFGPIGHLELGALAGLAGAPVAQAAHGVVVVAVFLVTLLLVDRKQLRAELEVRM